MLALWYCWGWIAIGAASSCLRSYYQPQIRELCLARGESKHDVAENYAVSRVASVLCWPVCLPLTLGYWFELRGQIRAETAQVEALQRQQELREVERLLKSSR